MLFANVLTVGFGPKLNLIFGSLEGKVAYLLVELTWRRRGYSSSAASQQHGHGFDPQPPQAFLYAFPRFPVPQLHPTGEVVN